MSSAAVMIDTLGVITLYAILLAVFDKMKEILSWWRDDNERLCEVESYLSLR